MKESSLFIVGDFVLSHSCFSCLIKENRMFHLPIVTGADGLFFLMGKKKIAAGLLKKTQWLGVDLDLKFLFYTFGCCSRVSEFGYAVHHSLLEQWGKSME